jgi:NitT/TauT family transport system ATP-binding protein
MAKLVLKDISYSYDNKKEILDSVSIDVGSSQIVSLLGASGSGKSTLLSVASKILKPTSGDVIDSFDKSSYLFQDNRLLPWKNMIDNIAFAIIDTEPIRAKRVAKAKEIARKLGLKDDDFGKYPKELSGGMAKRVAIARALITKPSMLYLDEPFTALDIRVKKELFDILLNLCKDKGISMLFITHDISEALRLSDKVLFLQKREKGSKIVESITINTPQKSRDNEYIYRYMLNLLENKKIENMFDI